jgi:parallel beta-helix repeat protein
MTKKVFLVLFILFFVFTSDAYAASYYVDTGGIGGTCNDSNPGSVGSPWCTIAKATATAVAGDIVYLRSGTYRETITANNSGSAGSPITFRNFSSETATVSASDLVTNWISLGSVESQGLFSTGFEVGDTSEFTSTTADAGNTVAVDTSIKNHGNYSLKASFGGTNKNARANKTVTSSTNAYTRVYFYLDDSFAIGTADQRVDVILMREGTSATRLRLAILRNASNQFYIKAEQLYPSTSTIYAGTPGEITLGSWNYIELNYKVDASVGGSQVWLNGVSKGSNFTTNTSGSVISRIEIGGNSSGQVAPSAGNIYFDDLKYDSSAIGAFSAAGDSSVYRATVSWTVSDVYENNTKLTSKDSLAAITGSGQWYYDTSPNYLYVRSFTDVDPDTVTLEVPNRSQAAVFSSHSYITLDGLTLKHARQSGQAGVKLTNSDHITISNSIVENNSGSGIYLITSDNNTISGNTIRGNNRQFGGGIRLENGADYNTISGNTITGNDLNGGNGMTFCGDSSCGSTGCNYNTVTGNTMHNFYDTCAYLDTANNYNVIEKNHCYNVYRQSDSQGGNGFHLSLGSSYNTVRNNVVHDVQRHGISVRSDDVKNSDGNKIYNNTVYNTGSTSGSGINVQGTNTNIEVYNNIAFKAAAKAFNVETNSVGGVTSDYNLFFNDTNQLVQWGASTYSDFSQYQRATGQDRHSFSANPLFISTSSYDFRVAQNSLAVNRGNNIAVGDDYNGTTRPQGGLFDMGAFESTYSDSPTATPTKTNDTEPNKCAEYQKIGQVKIFQVTQTGKRTRIYFVPPTGKYDRFYLYVSKTKNKSDAIAGMTLNSNQSSGALYIDFYYLPKGNLNFFVQAAYSCHYGSDPVAFQKRI